MIGTHMDITERRQAEERLRESEERYRLLFENNPNPMWVYDVESLAFLAVNDAAVDTYGYSRAEFFQMTIKDIRPAEDVSRLLENIARVTTGLDRAGYWRHRKRDGRIIDVEITSHSLQFEGRPAELVLVNDVTERKAAEDGLRKSEALYRQAIEVAGGIPYLQSYRTGITGIHYEFIGEGIRQITGYGPEEFNLPLWDSLVEESVLLGDLAHHAWEEAIRRVRTGVDSIWRCEHRVRARDGSIHWVFEAAVELYDQSGVSHGSIGMFQDITERKQAEERLRISEQRYRTLAQNLPDSALLLYDHDLRFILADGPELESAGFSRKRLEGRTLSDALPADFVQLVEPNMRRALAGEKVNAEFPFEDRIYKHTYVPLRDTTGNVAMAMILATNITQIKQVENALKDSQRRLSTALRATNVGVWEWDMRTNKTYWSDENYRLMGLEPGRVDARYENWAKAVHPEDLPVAEAGVNKAVNSRSDLNIEFRVVWPDGSIRWINDIGSLSFDGNNEPIGMYGIQMDVTERKRIQQELEGNRRRLAFLISGSPVIIYSARASGEFGATFVSGNVTKQMGYLPELFTKNPGFWIEHIHPDDLPRIQAGIDRLVETGSHRYEYRFRLADGRYIWMRDEMLLMRDQSGHPSEIIGSWMDITEQKRVAEERERLITELEAKNSELERFTYTVSHDLKSPLVTIKGFLGFLNQDIASGNLERQQNDIDRINNAALKMEQLLRDLLELSRIGRLVDTPEVIPFEYLAGEAMDLVHGQLEARGVTVQIQPDLAPVYGDRRRLAEVLQNLLDNAAKYMGRQADPRVEIGQRGEVNGNPLFYVRDNGIGIEPQHHERIFGLFNKLDPKTEGTGIGLALVKRVIEFHGGRIWVESEPGMGSTFFFTLPSRPAADSVI
jgi:PAS domain S-box-containing protein